MKSTLINLQLLNLNRNTLLILLCGVVSTTAPLNVIGQEIKSVKTDTTKVIKLGEVKVSASDKIIVETVDKTRINIKSQQIFEGDNAISILGKVPGFLLLNNRLLYDGKDINTVRINNRNISFSSQSELIAYLKGLDNRAISSIDIINHSAKNSASNSGKILNINIDNPLVDGFTLTPRIGFSRGHLNSVSGGIFSQIKKGKFSSNLIFGYANNRNIKEQNLITNYFSTRGSQTENNRSRTRSKPLNFNVDMQYDFTTNTYAGVSLKYNNNVFRENTNAEIIQFRDDESQLNTFNENSMDIHSNQYTASFYLNHKLDTIGQNLRFEVNTNFYDSEYVQSLKRNISSSDKSVDFQNKSSKAFSPNLNLDYSKKLFSKMDLSAGLQYFNMKNDENIVNNIQEFPFDYNESVFSQYISFKGSSKRISYQIGLRGESTSNTFNKYYHLFPSISLVREFGKVRFQVNYNRGISRPRGFMLSPFPFYYTNYFVRIGTPELLPAIRNEFSSSINYKKFRASLFYSKYKDNIETIQSQDNDEPNLIVERYVNLKSKNLGSIGLSYDYRTKKYSVTPYLYYSYSSFKQFGESKNTINYFRYASLSATYQISKSDRIEGKFLYYPTNKQVYRKLEDRSMLDLTYNKSLLKGKVNFQIFAEDIFKGGKEKGINSLDTFNSSFVQYRDTRQFGVSLRYNLEHGSKGKIQGPSKNVDRM